MPKNPPETDGLLTQREYADQVGVDNSYVSRRTNNGGLIDGTYRPRLDARWENGDPENGDLLGYTEPTPRPNSNGEATPESARKAAGVSPGEGDSQSSTEGRENGRARQNPPDRNRSTGQGKSSGHSRGGHSRGGYSIGSNSSGSYSDGDYSSGSYSKASNGLEKALERAGETAGAQAAKSPGILRGLLRLGGAAVGAILAANLVGRQAGPVLLGSIVGFGISEYAVRAEQALSQQPTRQIRPKGLRLPLTHGLVPGMNGAEPRY